MPNADEQHPLKRDHWTNAQVRDLLLGQQLCAFDGTLSEDSKQHNIALQMAADYFMSHFACSDDDFGALALDTVTGEIFHVGSIPPQ